MKRIIWIAALAALAMGMALPGQVINVTSPTASDDWCIGTTYSITWTKSGTMPNRVTIRLRRAGSPDSEAAVLVISAETDNNMTFRWPIPNSVAPDEYFIRIKTVGSPEGTPEVSGDSPNFTIKTCETPAPSSARIIVTEPDAEDEWCQGGSYTIRWRSIGKTPTRADIRLRRAGSAAGEEAVETIANDARNIGLGSYRWSIPGSVPDGEYFVRVRAGDLSGDSANFTITACPRDLELKNISYTYGHGGQIVARVANHLSPIDQDVRFYLVFPEMTRDGAQFVTRRLTLAAEGEDDVYLWALPQNNIPLKGLQVQANIDGPTSQIAETNEDNNRRETRIAILDISCSARKDELTLHKMYAHLTENFRVEFKIRVRHNLAKEVRNIHVRWTLSGPSGELNEYTHTIESLGPSEEHVWSVNETYGKEGRDGSKRPRLSEETTYRVVAAIDDPGDEFYDINPSNDSSGFTFSFPD